MLNRNLKRKLSEDISRWRAENWIDGETYDKLALRYEVSAFGIDRVLKYLGIVGGIILILGVLGLIGAVSESMAFGAFILLGISAAAFITGLRMQRDDAGRYPYSSRALIASAMIFYGGALTLAAQAAGMKAGAVIAFVGIAWLLPSFAAAYYFLNSFILVIALLGAFHWFGSWHRMLGRSSYAFSVQDPRAMIVFALLVLMVGIVHDLSSGEKYRRFYKVYAVISLLYCNMSVLILSIFDKSHILYIVLGFTGSLVQILAGARLQRAVFTGFGVTFMGIHIYTRYHELFWDKFHKGVFFLAGGIVLLAAGFGFEWFTGRRRKN